MLNTALAIVLTVLLSIASSQAQSGYTFKFFQVQKNPTVLSGINNSGRLIGTFSDGRGTHGFTKGSAGYAKITVPGFGDLFPNSINKGGFIVGVATNPNGSGVVGFKIKPSLNYFAMLSKVKGSVITEGFTGNDVLHIVGDYLDAKGVFHGFFRISGKPDLTIDYPGASQTAATCLNSADEIGGTYSFDSETTPQFGRVPHGFLLSDGTFTTIDYPGADTTDVTGLNNSGVIVGTYSIRATSATHGFVYSNGAFQTFDVPNMILTIPHGISDLGQIVGGCRSQTAVDQGFLATPLP